MRFKCPHCGKNSISVYDKIRFDPRCKCKCSECGGNINIPHYVFFTYVISLGSMCYIMRIIYNISWLYIIFAIVGMYIIYCIILILYVPIIKK
jgi:hypothetical protein